MLDLGAEAVEGAPTGIGIFDFTGDTVIMRYLNDGFYDMIGAKREDRTRFFEKGTIESVYPDDRAGIVLEARAAISENRMFECRFRNLDGSGSYIWIGIKASHKPLNETTERFYAAYHNIDSFIIAQEEGRKRYEDVLKKDLERNRAIMDSITSGIAELRLSDAGVLSVDSFNRQMLRMLGYDAPDFPQRAEEVQGTPLDEIFANALVYIHEDDRDRVMRDFIEHADEPEFSIEPYRMQKADASFTWIAEEVRANRCGEGYRTYYATYRDVTWELNAQEELHRRLEEEQALRAKADAANEAKTDFLSRMSHDMRTPLNGVIGMAYLAREQDNPPRTTECLAKIDTSAKFLLGLINDVLDMAKMESGKIELRPEPYPVDEFNDYLDAVIRPLCEEKAQSFILDQNVTVDSLPLCDKNGINQILFNLLSNAVKFTPEGGTITYRISGRQLSSDRVAIEHRISDTGIGLSEDFRARLFDPFTQEGRNDSSENRGSGLGLAIVKRLVDLMDGTIEVESTLGEGTTFILNFEFEAIPASDYDRMHKMERSAGSEVELKGRHVLLCEDHPLNQEIAKTLLEERGMAVDIAADGREGVAMFERSTPGFYDAILMDVRMPVMGGREASRTIRALSHPDARTIPIIAMTADAFEDDVRKCLDAGMDAHIAKPVDPQCLYEVLSAHMENGA